MNRKKLFLENFLVYGLGNIIGKIIPFIMLPIITSLMPDPYYFGINDLFSIVVSIGSVIVILGLYDSMFRLFFEKKDKDYQVKVCSTALFLIIVNSLLLVILCILFRDFLTVFIFGNHELTFLIFIAATTLVMSSLSTIVGGPTRLQNKRKIFIFINILSPVIGYSISIPLLIKGEYLLALPLANLLASLLTFLTFSLINHKWFSLKKVDFKIIKDLLALGIPLMPTFIIYWMFSSLDRLMIGKLIGNEYVGIYGVGARIAAIGQFIYIAFSSGWGYFTYSTMKDKDHTEVISKIFNYLALVSFVTFLITIPFSKILFEILFEGQYERGYVVFPYLFLSPLMLMLFQTLSSQYLVKKTSWQIPLLLLCGAFLNIFLNYYLIPLRGIQGAALATLIGYSATVLITTILLKIKRMIIIELKLVIIVAITFVYTGIGLMYTLSFTVAFLLLLFALLIISLLYLKELKVLLNLIINFLTKSGDKFEKR